MAKVHKLTHERLLEVLDFNPATGVFVWKVRTSNRVKVGDRAGVVGTLGYRLIVIDGEKFQATRLAMFYVNSAWPQGDVVPENGDLDDASIGNLSDRSRIDAARRRKMLSTNTSGFRGVSRAAGGRFQSTITWGYKQINLGNKFETAEDASEVYEEAVRRLALTSSEKDRAQALVELMLWRRQRAAWRQVERTYPSHLWGSFEAFCVEVTETPKTRFSMVVLDLSKPIGPANWRWSLPIAAENSTRDGIVAYHRANREANRNHYRDRDFRKNYGIGFAEYQAMLVAQRGVCAVCEKPETKIQNGTIQLLSVDHDHKTGAVRGLLCSNCNLAIGYACEDVTILAKAIGYLRRHGGSNVVPFEPAFVSGTLGSGA